MEAGRFEVAEAAFERAASAEGGLTRDGLLRLLARRAELHFAARSIEAMRRDLVRLASLAPDYPLGDHVAPQIRSVFDEVRVGGGALRLEVRAERTARGAEVSARVHGDPGELVRRVDLRARAAPAGAWVEGERGSVEVLGAALDGVDVELAAVGPGGAELVRVSRRVALGIAPGGVDPNGEPGADSADVSEEDWVVGLTIVLGALVLGGVAVGVGFAVDAGSASQLGPPIIEWM